MSVTQRLCDIDHFRVFTAIDKAREQGLCPPVSQATSYRD